MTSQTLENIGESLIGQFWLEASKAEKISQSCIWEKAIEIIRRYFAEIMQEVRNEGAS